MFLSTQGSRWYPIIKYIGAWVWLSDTGRPGVPEALGHLRNHTANRITLILCHIHKKVFIFMVPFGLNVNLHVMWCRVLTLFLRLGKEAWNTLGKYFIQLQGIWVPWFAELLNFGSYGRWDLALSPLLALMKMKWSMQLKCCLEEFSVDYCYDFKNIFLKLF